MSKELLALRNRMKAATSDTTIRVALTTVMAVHKPRIFEKGLDSNKAKIGTYSQEPISISKKNQARNTGKTYFKGGYSEYKSAIGKNPGYKNYRNTDQMMMDYGIMGSGNQWGFGFQNTENFNKSQYVQEQDETDVFDLSQDELDLLGDTIKVQLEVKI